jgi:glycosyltransferase involved in cell wall biosynthesis
MSIVIDDCKRETFLKQRDITVVNDDTAIKADGKNLLKRMSEQPLHQHKNNQSIDELAKKDLFTERRRIALITETWPPEINGVAHSIYQLTIGLKAKGHSILLVRPSQLDLTPDTVAEQTMLVKGYAIPRYRSLQFGEPAYQRLRSFFKNNQPDIVHIVTEGPLGLAALYAAKNLGIPVTSGFHSPFHEFSQFFGLSLFMTPIIAYLRYFHNRTAITCVPSEKTAQQLRNLGIKDSTVVSRGVDTQKFNPNHRSQKLRQSWGAGEHTTVLLYVGRLSPEKNIDLVITAYRELQAKQSFRAVRLVLVGDGPERQRLKKLGPDIIFAGMQTGEVLSQHYASADVFMFASRVETFGNVIPEAMASGLPVLAFNDAAAGQLVNSGQSGWLCPVADEWQFKQFTADLPKQIALQEMGKQAILGVEKMSWHSAVDKFEKVLEQVIQKNPLMLSAERLEQSNRR